MQRNFFVASDICKALKVLICYYFLLYIKLLTTFFLIDANITPAHPHPHNGARIRREVNLGTERPKGKGKEQGLHRSQVGWGEGAPRDLGSDTSPIAGLQVALLAQDCLVSQW